MAATRHEAFMLVGATATGKTAVAQRLAEELSAVILSADSMLVYRGMDIGTAKPTATERGRIRYGGMDLVNPDEEFHVAAWLAHAQTFLAEARAAGQPVIVVGGTGLYVKCLLRGLTVQPSADPAWRAAAGKMSRAELQKKLQELDPARYAALTESDRQNPRRLIRALELARSFPNRPRWACPTGAEVLGLSQPSHKTSSPAGQAGRGLAAPLPDEQIPSLGKTDEQVFQPLGKSTMPLVGLRLPPALLWARIQTRVTTMFEHGLLEEARRLRTEFPQLSATARQAIGYAEAFAVLDGQCTEAVAHERIAIRTRQLAKRQMTWFRHQAVTTWVETDDSAMQRVRELWRTHGPTPLAY